MNTVEVLKLSHKLNVEFDQEFKVERNGVIEKATTYKLTTVGLLVKHRDKGDWWEAFPQIISELEKGSAIIILH